MVGGDTATQHRCDRCEQLYTWDEVEPVVIPGYALLCRDCFEAVRSERLNAAHEGGTK